MAQNVVKSYMALFFCFANKAVHIEVVSDMTTPAWCAALRRYVVRRGCSKAIYSDNESNFIGTRVEISLLRKISKAKHEDSLQTVAGGVEFGSALLRSEGVRNQASDGTSTKNDGQQGTFV